ncbi:MAG: AbrB family transcriptional regulator [Cellvibrionaceae bacterium]
MIVLTLLIGAFGGAIAFLLSFPIPWLLGSMLSVSAFQFSGCKLTRPHKKIERLMRVLIGVVLGAAVASNLKSFSGLLLNTILIAIVFVILVTAFGTQYFSRLKDFKILDGFMSSLPGGLSFLIALSGDLGNRFPKIALIHTVRVIVLVFTFSLLAVFLEAENASPTFIQSFVFDVDHFSWRLTVLIVISAVIAEKAKIAGGHILFSLILSTLAYQFAWVEVIMPELVKTVAMIVFGSLLGHELSKKPDESYITAIFSSIFFTVGVMLVALLLALLISSYVDQHYLLFLLALAPGGIAEISLITIALGFDAGFVAAVHACRFGFIMLVGPIGLNLARLKEKGDR